MKKSSSPKKRFAETLRPGDKVALHSRAEGNGLRTLVQMYEVCPKSPRPDSGPDYSHLWMGIFDTAEVITVASLPPGWNEKCRRANPWVRVRTSKGIVGWIEGAQLVSATGDVRKRVEKAIKKSIAKREAEGCMIGYDDYHDYNHMPLPNFEVGAVVSLLKNAGSIPISPDRYEVSKTPDPKFKQGDTAVIVEIKPWKHVTPRVDHFPQVRILTPEGHVGWVCSLYLQVTSPPSEAAAQ